MCLTQFKIPNPQLGWGPLRAEGFAAAWGGLHTHCHPLQPLDPNARNTSVGTPTPAPGARQPAQPALRGAGKMLLTARDGDGAVLGGRESPLQGPQH